MVKSRQTLDERRSARFLRLLGDQGGQTSVEYVLAILVLAVAMGYALPVLFEALAELFTKMGAEFAKPYP